MAAARSRTSWADVADAEPAPPAPVPAAAASNGPALPDRSLYRPPHLRNRSAGSRPAPPASSAPPPRASPGLLGRPTGVGGGGFGGGGRVMGGGAPPRRRDREPNPFGNEEEAPAAEPDAFDEHQNRGINFEAPFRQSAMADLSSSISRSCDRRPWVLIEKRAHIGYCRNATTATGITSFQRIIEVSFELADPPGVSLWFVNCHGQLVRQAPAPAPAPRIVNAMDAFVLLVVCFSGSREDEPCHDYFIYRAGPGEPSLDLLPSPDRRGVSRAWAGIVSLCDGVSKDYAVVIPDLQYDFDAWSGKYDLHVYTKSNKWSTKDAQIAKDTETDHDKVLRHEGARVISFGGGSLGWVDLWCGILLCNVLDDNPVMRLIQWPVPEPHNIALELDMDLEIIAPEPFRDVTVINGLIRFVELNFHPVRGTCKKKLMSRGWTATTWIRMTSSKDWHKLFTVDTSDISLTYSRNPSLLSQISYQLPEILDESVPLDGVKMLTWGKVLSGGPILSLADDDVVYIMVKRDMEGSEAWVLAVNTRQNTLEEIQQCSSKSTLCFQPRYLPSSFSNYLDTTAGADIGNQLENNIRRKILEPSAFYCMAVLLAQDQIRQCEFSSAKILGYDDLISLLRAGRESLNIQELAQYATTEGICKTASETVTLYRRALDDFDDFCNVAMIGKIISGVVRVLDNLLQSMPSEVLETGKRLFALTKQEADMW